jgi:hypothetical protein
MYCQYTDECLYNVKGELISSSNKDRKVYLLEHEDVKMVSKIISLSSKTFFYKINELYSCVLLRNFPCIIPFYGFCIEDDIQIYQKPITGSMESYLRSQPDVFTRLMAWPMVFFNCLEGLYYLHHNNIRHDDISTRNIFMDYGKNLDIQNVYVADFGEISSNIDMDFLNRQRENFTPEMLIFTDEMLKNKSKYKLYNASDVWNMMDTLRCFLHGYRNIPYLYDPNYEEMKNKNNNYHKKFKKEDFKISLMSAKYGVETIAKIKSININQASESLYLSMDELMKIPMSLSAEQIKLLDIRYASILKQYFATAPTFTQFYSFSIKVIREMANCNFYQRVSITDIMVKLSQLSRVQQINNNLVKQNMTTLDETFTEDSNNYAEIFVNMCENENSSYMVALCALDMLRRSWNNSSFKQDFATIGAGSKEWSVNMTAILSYVITRSLLNKYDSGSFSEDTDSMSMYRKYLSEIKYELYNPHLNSKLQEIYEKCNYNELALKEYILTKDPNYFIDKNCENW